MVSLTIRKTILLSVVTVLFFGLIFLHQRNRIAEMFIPFKNKTTYADRALQPLRLKIERIHLDTKIESVGLTSTGAMDVPSLPENVAWFNLGPIPGMTGSAVIVGHSGWKGGKIVAFDNLHILRKGDVIYVENATGSSTMFVVQESRIYKADAIVPEVFTSTSGKHLNLISCIGIWDPISKNYSERLVVFSKAKP